MVSSGIFNLVNYTDFYNIWSFIMYQVDFGGVFSNQPIDRSAVISASSCLILLI